MSNGLFAFSAVNPSFNRSIITDAYISIPAKDNKDRQFLKVKALWDTGATLSVVTPHVVSALGLQATGVIKSLHAGGETLSKTYFVDIALPNKILIQGQKVSVCAEQNGIFDIIIGMDIISLGGFSITGQGERRKVSFCIPSAIDVDYAEIFGKINTEKDNQNI